MAGIYIHIPFCKQACNYCNFYFSTSLANKENFIRTLLAEIELTSGFLEEEKLETLYLGGGTPSLLTEQDLNRIINKIEKHYDTSRVVEFTLEANPDDLNAATIAGLARLKKRGLNRLSIGVQSFFDTDLQFMNRAHRAQEALDSVKRSQDSGFENISIDLIYGIPGMSDARWLRNLETAANLNIIHISSYALTVEPKTALEKQIRSGKAPEIDEEQTARQFGILMQQMKRYGYEQYEISNFARPGRHARHNSNYWFGKKYLGLGPSAHSFNGTLRRWNVKSNAQYIRSIAEGKLSFEAEKLTLVQRVNEKIMTMLRTQWGLNIAECAGLKPDSSKLLLKNLESIDTRYYLLQDGVLKLTDEGKLFADGIASQLFLE